MKRQQLFQNNLTLWAKTCPKQAFMLPYTDTSKVEPCQTQKGEENIRLVIEGKKKFLHAQTGAAEEARCWFEALSLKGIFLECVYGVGLGYYYDAIRPWLKKNRKRRLVFLEDDLVVIHRLLETQQGADMLRDSQVQILSLSHSKADTAIFEGLYWNFALQRLVVTALRSYQKAKPDLFEALRHRIAFDAAMKNALVDEYVRYGANFYINFYQNLLCLEGSYLGNHLFGKFHQVPAIICGAGPSLQKNMHLLPQLMDKAIVFSGGSALNVLNKAGLQPHFGAGIDPNPEQLKRLRESTAHEVPFFYRNRMNHDAFSMIRGPRLYITGSGGYDTAEHFEKKLGIHSDKEIDEGHNVVNFCVELAHAMGCNPIIFMGLDLAFTGMKGYASGVVEDATVSSSAILDVEDEDSKAILKTDIYGKPTYTLWKWLAESEWIGDYAKEHPLITMINCTEGGIGFPGIPNQTLQKVAKTRLFRAYDLRNRIHGETQNSAMPKITLNKIVRAMKELSASLKRTNEKMRILLEDAEENMRKIQSGNLGLIQSGRAILAETELEEEPGYKAVVAVFNEVYAHLLSGDLHQINVGRYSEKQRQLKKLELGRKKFAFLQDVAKVNEEIIEYALEQKKKGKADEVGSPKRHQVEGKHMDHREHALSLGDSFQPIMIPEIREDGKDLGNGYRLRVLYDSQWKLHECYVERKGKPDGQALLFYADGKIKAESIYKEGKLHGPSKFWDNNGTLLAESEYMNGRQVGDTVWYYPSGEIYSLQRYKKGRLYGTQEYYHKDGTVRNLISHNP